MQFDSTEKMKKKINKMNNNQILDNASPNSQANASKLKLFFEFQSKDDNQVGKKNTSEWGYAKINDAKKTLTPTGNESPPLFMSQTKIAHNPKNSNLAKGNTSLNFISNYAKNQKNFSKDYQQNSVGLKTFTDKINDDPKLKSEITSHRDYEERKDSAKKMKINSLAKSSEIIANISGKSKIYF